jgi:hypothetical protein
MKEQGPRRDHAKISEPLFARSRELRRKLNETTDPEAKLELNWLSALTNTPGVTPRIAVDIMKTKDDIVAMQEGKIEPIQERERPLTTGTTDDELNQMMEPSSPAEEFEARAREINAQLPLVIQNLNEGFADLQGAGLTSEQNEILEGVMDKYRVFVELNSTGVWVDALLGNERIASETIVDVWDAKDHFREEYDKNWRPIEEG